MRLHGEMHLTGEDGGTLQLRASNFVVPEEWPVLLFGLLERALLEQPPESPATEGL